MNRQIVEHMFTQMNYDKVEVEMLTDVWLAVEKAGKMEFLAKTDIPMFTENFSPDIVAIHKHMKYNGHSGHSYAWTMRNVEQLVKKLYNILKGA
jgi:hypothetical protein